MDKRIRVAHGDKAKLRAHFSRAPWKSTVTVRSRRAVPMEVEERSVDSLRRP